jgi:MraZ protein
MTAFRPKATLPMFLGEYLHIFDTKNRISIPSKFRKNLGHVVVVTRGLDHCLYVYSRKAWEKEAQKYAAEVNGSAARRGLARLFLAGSFEAEVDKSGRVLIPENLKSFASIKERAVIAGVADRVEIWEEAAWKKYTKEIERDADSFAEKVDTTN